MIPLGCNMYVVLKVQTFIWPGGSVGWSAALSRRRSRVRVSSGSLLFLTANLIFFLLWDLSSAGRASALQAEGHRFEPYRSHILCRSGGTGRRPGLKIPWVVIPVPVRFRSAALVKNGRNVEFTAFLLFFCFKMFEHL